MAHNSNTKVVCLSPDGSASQQWRNSLVSSSNQTVKEDMSRTSFVQACISTVMSRCSPTQRIEYRRHTPWGTLCFYLLDHGEDMWKWDGKHTSTLEAQVHELQGKKLAEWDFSKENAAPGSTREFPRQSRKGWSYFWSSWRDCWVIAQEVSDSDQG